MRSVVGLALDLPIRHCLIALLTIVTTSFLGTIMCVCF